MNFFIHFLSLFSHLHLCICAEAQTVSHDTPRTGVRGPQGGDSGAKAGGTFRLFSPYTLPQGHPAWACLIFGVPLTFIWKKDSTACMSLEVTQVERAERKQFVSSHGWLEGSGVGCTSWPLHSWVSIIHPFSARYEISTSNIFVSICKFKNALQSNIYYLNKYILDGPKWFCPWKQIPKRSLSQIIWVCNLCHKLED